MSEITTDNFCHEQCEFFARDGKCPANGLPERCQLYRLRMELISMKGSIKKITNMDFPRLCELAEADKDGRLVVLPCKVGDTVYYIRRNVCKHADVTGYCDVDRWYAKKGVKAESGCKDCPHLIPETRIIATPFRLALLDEKKCGHLHVSEIFLTRAEAEAALQKEAQHE